MSSIEITSGFLPLGTLSAGLGRITPPLRTKGLSIGARTKPAACNPVSTRCASVLVKYQSSKSCPMGVLNAFLGKGIKSWKKTWSTFPSQATNWSGFQYDVTVAHST